MKCSQVLRRVLYTWGTDTVGQLGQWDSNHTKRQDVLRPTIVESVKVCKIRDPIIHLLTALQHIPMTGISCAAGFNCVVSICGKAYSWGSMATGQLGIGDVSGEFLQYSTLPLQIKMSHKRKIRQVSCGTSHAAAVTKAGELFVWGCANGHRLGLGSKVKDCVHQPVYVNQLRKHRVWQVFCRLLCQY